MSEENKKIPAIGVAVTILIVMSTLTIVFLLGQWTEQLNNQKFLNRTPKECYKTCRDGNSYWYREEMTEPCGFPPKEK